jgi:U3 small nucleolar RNA-associated protein 21
MSTSSPDRPSKRSKPQSSPPSSSKHQQVSNQPRLFAPFRALGFISNHVPIAVQTRSNKNATKGPSISIVSCLGDAWAMWEGDKMGLVFVGKSRTSQEGRANKLATKLTAPLRLQGRLLQSR